MTKPTRTRKTLWLEFNGVIDTLQGHLTTAGYRKNYQSVIAKRQKCVPSRIPLKVIGEYLGGKVKEVERPDDWRKVVYGKAKFINHEQELIRKFMAMKLSSNPMNCAYY